MDTVFVLGRQPEIGLAELESLSSANDVHQITEECALSSSEIDFSHLGSSQKSGSVIAVYDTSDIRKIFAKIGQILPEIVKQMPENGKIKIGASIYGIETTPYAIQGELLKLKKTLRSQGRSARVVPNETTALSSATTYHNRLHRELGLEFIIARDSRKTYIARATNVQDIDAYRVRDRERPKRDAFVGMLPPKLAQTMINLAAVDPTKTLWDPFCGTGVVLLEALLQGIPAYGSDISPKMIDHTKTNLEWLTQKYDPSITARASASIADATTAKFPTQLGSDFSVVTEMFLGQPIGGQQPSPEKMTEIVHGVNKIARDFLENLASQATPDSRHCIAMPAWYVSGHEYHLPVIKDIESFGFEKITFKSAADLIYRREDQSTAREIIVLRKK